MNGFVGSSFYDTINKLMIGFLILFPFAYGWHKGNLSTEWYLTLILITCWITGLFFWAIVAYVGNVAKTNFTSGNLHTKSHISALECIFKNNNALLIKQAYNHLTNKYSLEPTEFSHKEGKELLTEYIKAYYIVQSKGLLGNVGQLESFSEFFRNLWCVSILWILYFLTILSCQIPITLHQHSGRNQSPFLPISSWDMIISLCIIFLLVMNLILCPIFRKQTELRIILRYLRHFCWERGLQPQIKTKQIFKKGLG